MLWLCFHPSSTPIRDLILMLHDMAPYDKLKEQLVTQTTVSQQKRLQQLIHLEELGDSTPSQFLRRMTQLLGDQATVDSSQHFLKELFLQRLPAHVRMVLASKESDNLKDLATLVNRVMEVATPLLSAIDTSSLSTEVEQLSEEIATLKTHFKSFSALPPTFLHSFKQRSPSPARPRGEEIATLKTHSNLSLPLLLPFQILLNDVLPAPLGLVVDYVGIMHALL
ncbi:PREDICTED: uncharacterized protein LOC105314948 [Amphimedon queenslandica]|uniref:Uncharacterized protein n=1 Tax=Amphimedon queenslandica TaxID=400682 RepID=A0A1X7TF74_AMPQE|nr:PREDICTED: uncharacterized protein LOC105314948 [Amphimedon queenslandica]|eukprot:XP_011407699.1 PREDICTED: uncharacterized protein LOC105314948 [Amphimedon queenslandica]